MSNLSHAEIAAILWNKEHPELPFSELSDERRTELEIKVASGELGGDAVIVEVLPEVAEISEETSESDAPATDVLVSANDAVKKTVKGKKNAK